MSGVGQNFNTIATVNELLGRICPAMRKPRPTRNTGLPRVEDVTFVTLYLDDVEVSSEARMTLRKGRVALSADTRGMIPAGNYQIHVYDTNIEAIAALRAIEATGHMSDVERIELPAGEGVLLLRCGKVPAVTSDHLFMAQGADMADRIQNFEGAGGPVCVNIIDNRLDLARETGIFFRPRGVFSSISYPRGDVCRIVNNEVVHQVDADGRGRLLARIVEMSCRTPSALRFCQRSLESITGALVSISSVSVDHVVDQLEDMLEGLEEDLLTPRAEDMHDLVVNHARNIGQDPEGIARDVAWTALRKNMTRRA